ncbi:MAG: TGS domain-containing protein, partial [Oscillospiraceae bacterium]
MIKVTLKDGSQREFDKPISYGDIAKSISPKLLEKATAALVNGKVHDLRDMADKDVSLEILTFDDK